eukprot:14660837-Heterocapsa_arctica.AAC.1
MVVAGLNEGGSSWQCSCNVSSVSWGRLGCSCAPAFALRSAPGVPDGCSVSGRVEVGAETMTDSMASSMLC